MMMIKKASILVVIFFAIGLNTQAQNTALEDSGNKSEKAELVMAFKLVTDGAVSNKPFDSTKVVMAMSAVIMNEEDGHLEKNATLITDNEPRIEMFSITKDSIKPKDK